MNIKIRTIDPKDNPVIAGIIRSSLTEFGANKPGTVFFDSATDHLSDVFKTPRSCYFIAEKDGVPVGGAGIYSTEGLPEGTCELVKMYLVPEVRGTGTGRLLMDRCFEFAKSAGYQSVYLETLPELYNAVAVYEHLGFERLPAPLGNSGHFGCDIWMLKKI